MLKKTIVLIPIFLISPLVAIILNWKWQPESLNTTSKYLFYITQTASFPWAVITSAFFFFLFCIFLKNKTKKSIIFLWCILVFAILFGQIIKSVTKSTFAEPRPYVVWLKKEFKIDSQYFYQISKKEKQTLLDENLSNVSYIPDWLLYHWKHETGYSFPSGHALFSATWAFLALFILGFKRHPIIVSAFIVWSILIDISRLILGMHYAFDLIIGILIAWTVSLISYFLINKFKKEDLFIV